jgi:hypothetical protein
MPVDEREKNVMEEMNPTVKLESGRERREI